MEPIKLEDEVVEVHRVGLHRWLLAKLSQAFQEARKGKLNTCDEHIFEQHWMENMVSLRDSILECRYKPSASVTFVIFDPMVREIFANFKLIFHEDYTVTFMILILAGWGRVLCLVYNGRRGLCKK